MAQRKEGQSQLDYLWVNYGENRSVINEIGEDNDIPTFGLVQSLIKDICSSAVGSVTRSGDFLITKSLDGNELSRIDVSDLFGEGTCITDFGRDTVSQEDIDNGCPYLLYSPMYYLELSDGTKYIVPIDVYTGGETNVIRNEIIDNTIQSYLKYSAKTRGVVLTPEEDGLTGYIYLDGSTKDLRFRLMTDVEYEQTVHDSTTVYFIKNKPYLYFGDYKVGSILDADLDELSRRLDNIEQTLKWEEHG